VGTWKAGDAVPDVVFYEVFAEETEAIKRFLPRNVKARFMAQPLREQDSGCHPARVISIRTQSRIPLSWATHLNGILTRSRGYDHLASYCREAGINIACGHLGDYCSRAVAEHAVMAMMALLRKLKRQIQSFDAFSRDHLTGVECRGRHALIVGVGCVGAQIVDIARGLRMEVKGVDIVARFRDLEYVSLREGLRWADVIFCACCLTGQTRGLLRYNVLKQARAGGVFINIARGEISPIEDLARLLSEGILSGLSLDVYEQEGVLADHLKGTRRSATVAIKKFLKLKNKDNIIFTPHNAFNTQEALEAKARLSAQAIQHFLQKGAFPAPVPLY
jgi:D-lactate dehydrogenase